MNPLTASSILLLRQQNTKWVQMKFYTGDLTLSVAHVITLRFSGAGKYQELTATQMWHPNFESFNTAMRVVTLLWSLVYGFLRNMIPAHSVPSPEDRGRNFHRNVCAYPPNYTVS